jgi:hypothetical protein
MLPFILSVLLVEEFSLEFFSHLRRHVAFSTDSPVRASGQL